MGLLIDSAKMIADNHAQMEDKIAALTYRVLLNEDGDLEWHGRVNGEDVVLTKEPDTSAWLRFKAWFMKIAPESQL
jgi:putative cardiolipin synthase